MQHSDLDSPTDRRTKRPASPLTGGSGSSILVRVLGLVASLLLASAQAFAVDTLFADQTLASRSGAELGHGIDIDGALAAVLSPEDQTIRTFTFDLASESWIVGPTIAPPDAVALGPAVAVSGFTVFYVVITALGADPPATQSWELRAQRLFSNPSTETVLSFQYSAPAALDAAEDLVVAGVPALDGSVSAYGLIYGYNGTNWLQRRLIGGVGVDSEYGTAVATNGFWTAFTDPAQGEHGAVEILISQPGGLWGDWQTIEYATQLQGDVSFGASVAIDEGCLVVGMPDFNDGFLPSTPDTGAFASYGLEQFGSWTLQQVLVPSAPLDGDHWGGAISLAGPNLVLGGRDVQRLNMNPQGDVALFRRTGRSCSSGSWSEIARLRATPLVIDPAAPGDYGQAVAADELSGVLVGDPMGPTGELDGRAYAFSRRYLALFADGFESGDTSSWSTATP